MAKLAAPAWAGARKIRVLAGPVLEEWQMLDPLGLEEEMHPATPSTPSRPPRGRAADMPMQEHLRGAMLRERAHKEILALHQRASELAERGCKMEAIQALEEILHFSAKQGLEGNSAMQKRLSALVAAAIAWSLDLLAEVADAGNSKSQVFAAEPEDLAAMEDEALEMLSFVHSTCNREPLSALWESLEVSQKSQLSALTSAAFGCVYRAKHKLQAALRYFEEAASGNCGWAHSAVLLDLGAVRLMLSDAAGALVCINEAVLAARSAIGMPLQVSAHELIHRLDAAKQAVASAFPQCCIAAGQADAGGPRQADATCSEDARPQDEIQGQEASANALPQTRSAAIGPASRMPRSVSSTEVKVAELLLASQTLLWPWPEFREVLPPARVSAVLPEIPEASPEALAGFRRHAACLQQTWQHWGAKVSAEEVPGGPAVLRECVLLGLMNAALAMSHRAPATSLKQYAIPTLVEGVTLALILLGSQNGLTTKVTRLLQKASLAAEAAAATMAVKERATAVATGTPRTRARMKPPLQSRLNSAAALERESPYGQPLPRGKRPSSAGPRTPSCPPAKPPANSCPGKPSPRAEHRLTPRQSAAVASTPRQSHSTARATPDPGARSPRTPRPASARASINHQASSTPSSKSPRAKAGEVSPATPGMLNASRRRPASAGAVHGGDAARVQEKRQSMSSRQLRLAMGTQARGKGPMLSQVAIDAEEQRLTRLLRPVLRTGQLQGDW